MDHRRRLWVSIILSGAMHVLGLAAIAPLPVHQHETEVWLSVASPKGTGGSGQRSTLRLLAIEESVTVEQTEGDRSRAHSAIPMLHTEPVGRTPSPRDGRPITPPEPLRLTPTLPQPDENEAGSPHVPKPGLYKPPSSSPLDASAHDAASYNAASYNAASHDTSPLHASSLSPTSPDAPISDALSTDAPSVDHPSSGAPALDASSSNLPALDTSSLYLPTVRSLMSEGDEGSTQQNVALTRAPALTGERPKAEEPEEVTPPDREAAGRAPGPGDGYARHEENSVPVNPARSTERTDYKKQSVPVARLTVKESRRPLEADHKADSSEFLKSPKLPEALSIPPTLAGERPFLTPDSDAIPARFETYDQATFDKPNGVTDTRDFGEPSPVPAPPLRRAQGERANAFQKALSPLTQDENTNPQSHTQTQSDSEPSQMSPHVIKQVAPMYPRRARERGVEGIVTLQVRLNAEGVPTAVRVDKSSGRLDLDAAARAAVMQWRFAPAEENGEAVAANFQVRVAFRLLD